MCPGTLNGIATCAASTCGIACNIGYTTEGGACVPTPTSSCATAVNLGSLSGDTGAGKKTADGTGSQWFRIRVFEDDLSIFGRALTASMTLTSPPGTNFDLFVFVSGTASSVECLAATKSSTTSGADSVAVKWGELETVNGVDDSRNVTVEVRWVSGIVVPPATWSLTISGNTP